MLNISQLNQTTVFSYVQKQCKQSRNTDGGAKQCAYMSILTCNMQQLYMACNHTLAR